MIDLMNTDPILGQELITRIEDGNKLQQCRKVQQALEIYLGCWDKLPSQKTDIELFGSWIADCISDIYFYEKDFKNSLKWMKQSFEARAGDEETSSSIKLGAIYMKMGDEYNAFEWFNRAYSIGKKRAFQEFPKEYWDFYKSRSKK